jgi:hypothetical protein
MPGPGGNQPKKAGKVKKMMKPSATGRYSEGYGPEMPVPGANPGAGVTMRKRVSDAIRGYGSHNSKTRYGG